MPASDMNSSNKIKNKKRRQRSNWLLACKLQTPSANLIEVDSQKVLNRMEKHGKRKISQIFFNGHWWIVGETLKVMLDALIIKIMF